MTFDPVAGAQAAAELTCSLILNPQRAARLVEYHARDSANPGLEEVIETLMTATWHAVPKPGLQQEIAQVVRLVALESLLSLATDSHASLVVRSIAAAEIQKEKRLFSDPYAASLVSKFQGQSQRFGFAEANRRARQDSLSAATKTGSGRFKDHQGCITKRSHLLKRFVLYTSLLGNGLGPGRVPK